VHELSIDWERRLDNAFPTLAEELGRSGYATVGIVANTRYAGAHTGLARGFDRYEDYRLSAQQILRMTRLCRQAVKVWSDLRGAPVGDDPDRIAAAHVNARFLRWLDRRSDRSYFAFLNYYDAHAPYLPPEPFWSQFLDDVPRRSMPIDGRSMSPPAVALRRSAYDGAIAHLDHELGALFDALIKRGALDNTLIIITADHGEEFAEHGLMGHGHSLYTQSVRVPLVLVWPGRLPSRMRVAEPISLAQIPGTIADLVGSRNPFPGPSLARHWQDGPATEPTASTSALTYARNLPKNYPVSHGSLASARLGQYRYIRTGRDTIGELYDHGADSMETRNLAREPSLGRVLRQLRDTVGGVMPRRR
jgi:arylsulfatase A-like enzyme